jgi:radical SAM superfamily enzyme YgiQ (UPF0313 family)
MSYSFEMGPIRPPSEAYSILVRITRNCPWNKCAFCSTYKDQKFSRRPLEDIKKDIDSIFELGRRIASTFREPDTGGGITEEIISRARGLDPTPDLYYRQVAFWMAYGMRSAFLQDANSLVLPTAELAEILIYLREKFPALERVTSYARSKTLSRKSPEELKELRAAGLSRIHIGMESGCDEVLQLVNKGVTSEEHILAGKRVMEAGFDLSEYYMPGLGGRELSSRNAVETARVVSAINPTFIRIRSTVPLPGTHLFDLLTQQRWTPMTEDEKVREIREFISNLGDVTGTLMSDHMMNLIEDIEGRFPDDRGKMLSVIDAYLGMSDDDRESFIIGRRLGQIRHLSEYRRDDRIEEIKRELKARFSTIDAAVMEIVKNFL